MRINKIMLGDSNIGFCESRLKPGFNLIYSDDNNKGKTILLQSCFYALGNEPLFPGNFPYKDYYHIVNITTNDDEEIEICRKDKSYMVLRQDQLMLYESTSEFKRFLNTIGIEMPTIIKDDKTKMIDPLLLYEMFFIRQDERRTTNINNSNGYYNKKDFINMLFSLKGIGNAIDNGISKDEISNKIKELELELKQIKKQNKILKNRTILNSTIFSSSEKDEFDLKIKQMNELKDKIVSLKNEKNTIYNRKLKAEEVISELNSLNRSMKSGKLHCMNCGSEKIAFSDEEESFTFDISTSLMRKKIIESYNEKRAICEEQVEHLTFEINNLQTKLQDLLKSDDISIDKLIIFKPELVSATEADKRLASIPSEISDMKAKLLLVDQNNENILKQQQAMIKRIEEKMNDFFNILEPNNDLDLKLFATRGQSFSGCESPEYVSSRVYALQNELKHNYPIVIDSFRSEELSTDREEKIVNEFKKLNNQIIFTATFKKEEYHKYDNDKEINAIDYSNIPLRQLLSTEYGSIIKEELNKFGII